MRGVDWRSLAIWAIVLCSPIPAIAAEAPTIPPSPTPSTSLTISDLVAPPTLSLPRLSPSGKQIAIVRRVGEIDQILRLDLPDLKATLLYQTRPVPAKEAKDKWRNEISFLDWKSDDTLLVSVSGPVAFTLYGERHIYEVPIHIILKADGKSAPLFLNEKVTGKTGTVDLSWIQSVLRDDPDHIQLMTRPSLQSLHVERVDIHTGERHVLESGGEDVVDYGSDRKGNIVTRTLERFRTVTLEGRAPGETKWTRITELNTKEERELAKYEYLGAGEAGILYVAAKPETPADGDTKSVRSFDLKAMKLGPVVWSNPNYDVDAIVQDADTGQIAGGCYWVDIYRCDFKSPVLTANLKGLSRFFEDKRNLSIISQDLEDKHWILSVEGPDEPGSYYLYDVENHKAEFLGARWPTLPPEKLAAMRRFDFKARDGAALFGYVSEPASPSTILRPLIVMPHGGPEVRDKYSFDTWAQFLTSKGYVVLQPNFRGSGGLGRKFAEAGYGQWGGLMHDDVMDATRALIAEGKVDPKRVCIIGASYGGSEAMYAAAREPSTFRCAISVAGLSDLMGEMKYERTFGTDSVRYKYWAHSQGNPDTDSERMLAHSPYRMAAQWSTPLLLIHGDDDKVDPVEESRQMNRALQAAGKSVRYLEVKGMGHGPSSDEEMTKVFNEMDAFLATYLKDANPKPQIATPTR